MPSDGFPGQGPIPVLLQGRPQSAEVPAGPRRETDAWILMMETKAGGMMNNAEVEAKRNAGVQWCAHASAYAEKHGGKPWRYVLVPHEVVAENMTLAALVDQFTISLYP